MSEELELMLFQIITAAGASKSNFIQAIQEAKAGNFEAAEGLIKDGDDFLSQAHEPHSNLLTMEANGDQVVYLLLIHAEDQMMSCEVFRQMAVEFIDVYKKLAA